MIPYPNVILIVETFVTFVLAITVHEAAHAFMAALLGDASPISEGRLSLAPRRQMATVGTIVAIVSAVQPFPSGLGWGRPVRIDARRMRIGPNFGTVLVALAGPAVNLVLGLGIAAGLQFIPGYAQLGLHARAESCSLGTWGLGLQTCLSGAQPAWVLRIEQFLFAFAVTNIVLALVNLIPLHPLDGYRVLFALLPNESAIAYRSYEPYMEFSLLVLFFVLPYILALVHIGFSPTFWLFGLANQIAGNFASFIATFYLFL
jgi:Zn-dependent protease